MLVSLHNQGRGARQVIDERGRVITVRPGQRRSIQLSADAVGMLIAKEAVSTLKVESSQHLLESGALDREHRQESAAVGETRTTAQVARDLLTEMETGDMSRWTEFISKVRRELGDACTLGRGNPTKVTAREMLEQIATAPE